AEAIIGRQVEMLLPDRFRQRHMEHRAAYAKSGRARPMGVGLELFARHADGAEFPVEISLSPIRDGEQTLVAAAIRDVSERKRVERELKEARAEADRANLAKSRFLATASHDLRQPLQTLGMLNGTLRRLVSEPDALEALDQQGLAIASMSRLLNALLDISKLESGAIKPDITDFQVASLLDELRGEFASLAHSKGLQFTIEASADSVHSDPSLVGQILRNLVANAIKYTHRGSVWVVCRRDADAVRIDVRDSGIGIPAEQLRYIYDEFYQVGVAPNTSRDGYGLGLSIVQRLVRLLGLRIDVQSEVGIGSTFSLILPVGAAAGAPSATRARAPAAPSRSGVQRHVLLVEDDPGVRNATRVFLKGEGYRVTATASLKEAVRCADETRDIDIIVSDYHLDSEGTGADVIASVRRVLNRAIAAVLITGDTSSAIREFGRDARLRITSKPLNADEMLALIRELLGASA
ncbi:MAG TPA: hybrid sensor histidine kinase/response regulator, partial [Steroidobacteraceae bacterium]|nr:hybrid sensor histidine kinase/response regulator [Steroidobacteraceae bacterium]